MAHPNEEAMRKGLDAFSKGDLGTVGDLLADDIVWHIPGRSPVSKDHRGKDEVLGFFGKLAELSGGTFRLDVHDVVANDEHVVVLSRNTAEREGKTLDLTVATVSHMEDGKVKEAWAHPSDLYAADEFWS